MVDMWDTLNQQEQMLSEHEAEYAELKADLCDWTDTKIELGIFRIQIKATAWLRGSDW